jgi:exonuclease-1
MTSTLFAVAAPVASRQVLRNIAGQTVGIDGTPWLLQLRRRHPLPDETEACLADFAARLQLLRDSNVVPICIFEGAALPAKQRHIDELNLRRELERKRAMELSDSGFVNEAFDHYANSVAVDYNLVRRAIEIIHGLSLSYFVAPSESTAQLSYMARIGMIDSIMTDNPEILLFQPECPILIRFSERVPYFLELKLSAVLNHLAISFQDFLICTCLSGNPFIKKISNLGLFGTLARFRSTHGYSELLAQFGDEETINDVDMALNILTFLKVYDPNERRLVELHDTDCNFRFLAPKFKSASQLKAFIEGRVDPSTFEYSKTPALALVPFLRPEPQISIAESPPRRVRRKDGASTKSKRSQQPKETKFVKKIDRDSPRLIRQSKLMEFFPVIVPT